MPEKRAVRLVHFLTNLGADRVVRFRDVERDLAMIVPRQNLALSIFPGKRREEIEGNSGFWLLDFAGDRKAKPEKTIDEAMFCHLDALPEAKIFWLGEIGDRAVQLAGGAEGAGSRVNQPVTSLMREIRAVGHRPRRVCQRRVAA